MRIVSNTSPLSDLASIGRLDLPKQRYGTVRVPAAVARELSALSHSGAQTHINAALAEGWLVIEDPPAFRPTLPFALDSGETEAIALALATKADLLLADERRGQEAARQPGLVVAGVLGELLRARQVGLLLNLRSEIRRLRSEAGFFVDTKIEQFILPQVGE
jgi:hypothetical protein